MRLIDADVLKLELRLFHGANPKTAQIISEINRARTIDAVPVRHAKLLNAHPYGECSTCGYLIDIRDEFNYCPKCGARLDGERKEE